MTLINLSNKVQLEFLKRWHLNCVYLNCLVIIFLVDKYFINI